MSKHTKKTPVGSPETLLMLIAGFEGLGIEPDLAHLTPKEIRALCRWLERSVQSNG